MASESGKKGNQFATVELSLKQHCSVLIDTSIRSNLKRNWLWLLIRFSEGLAKGNTYQWVNSFQQNAGDQNLELRPGTWN